MNNISGKILAKYISSTGESIKVIKGNRILKFELATVEDSWKNRYIYINSLAVYSGTSKIEEYFEEELPKGIIPFLKSELEQLAESGADADEVVQSINTLILTFSEQEDFPEENIDNSDL